MGIINVTPDSFSDGGHYLNSDHAIAHALKLVEEGVDILDIGGESTRPGAMMITPEEEQSRVLPVIKKLRQNGIKTPISIDTRNSETMKSAIAEGVNIINDVSALSHDPQSLSLAVEVGVPVILMHMQGTPQTMQKKPIYSNIVDDVYRYLELRIKDCIAAGMKKENIIVDVGIGFGKTLNDNLTLLKSLSHFHSLGCPILLGTSRKSFIEKICIHSPADERLGGSIASALKGLEQNVQIFRVHDVKQTKQAFDVWQSIN